MTPPNFTCNVSLFVSFYSTSRPPPADGPFSIFSSHRNNNRRERASFPPRVLLFYSPRKDREIESLLYIVAQTGFRKGRDEERNSGTGGRTSFVQ